MAKPTRSPLLGYNHNVKYGGHIFHVQTEDSGPGNPHIFTHLFFEGSILGSKRAEYDAAAPDETVRGLMQSQHKGILKELKQKRFDERIMSFFESRGQAFRSDDVVPDPAAAIARAPEIAAPAEVIPDDAAITAPVSASEAAPEATPAPSSVELAPELPPELLPELPPELLPELLPELPPATQALPLAEAAVLDLDALPAPSGEPAPTPEPLPMHLTKPAVPGPGTYTFRRPTRDQLSNEPGSFSSSPGHTPTRPTGAPTTPAKITPVVVQRQVVVGAGGPPATTTRKIPTTPVRRRPVSGGPYVVKEGSHAAIAGVRRGDATRPVATTPEPAKAPRTAEPPRPAQAQPKQEGAPASFVTDQSLDDVILAYLSQGDGKP